MTQRSWRPAVSGECVCVCETTAALLYCPSFHISASLTVTALCFFAHCFHPKPDAETAMTFWHDPEIFNRIRISQKCKKKKKKKSERTEEINFFHICTIIPIKCFLTANLTLISTTARRKDLFTFRCWGRIRLESYHILLLYLAGIGRLLLLETRFPPLNHGASEACAVSSHVLTAACVEYFPTPEVREVASQIFFKGTLTSSFDLWDSLWAFVLGCRFKHPQQSCFWPPSSATTDLNSYHVK